MLANLVNMGDAEMQQFLQEVAAGAELPGLDMTGLDGEQFSPLVAAMLGGKAEFEYLAKHLKIQSLEIRKDQQCQAGYLPCSARLPRSSWPSWGWRRGRRPRRRCSAAVSNSDTALQFKSNRSEQR